MEEAQGNGHAVIDVRPRRADAGVRVSVPMPGSYPSRLSALDSPYFPYTWTLSDGITSRTAPPGRGSGLSAITVTSPSRM